MDKSLFRARICAEKQELQILSEAGRDSRAPVELDQQSIGRLSRMGAIQQQSMDLAREERRKARIAMLTAALRRIDGDEFGFCFACGEEIAMKRLEIDPTVTLCVDCQR